VPVKKHKGNKMTKSDKITEMVNQPMVRELFETQQETMTDQFRSSLEKSGSAEEIEDFDEYCKKVHKALDFINFEPMLTEAYDEFYTEEEIDFLYELYNNPIWDVMQKKLPTVTREVMIRSQNLTHEILQSVQEEGEKNA
jgi:hypothetical protein